MSDESQCRTPVAGGGLALKALRQTDWRFLFGSQPEGGFEHLLLTGGGPGLAEHIIEQSIAKQVSCEMRGERFADAVVVLRGAGTPLHRAARCLVSGGVLCYEYRAKGINPFVSSSDRATRWIRQAGLYPIETYFVYPDFEHREAYIPDTKAILAWYLATFSSPAARSRLFSGAHASVARRLWRDVVVTASNLPGNESPGIPGEPLLAEEFKQPGLRSVLVTGGDTFNRIARFPFTPASAEPLAALKFGRIPARNAAIVREQRVLRSMHKCSSPGTRASIPEPRGILRWNGLAVGVESCASGRSLETLVRRKRLSTREQIQNLSLAVDWLVNFNRTARDGHARWNEKQFHRWIEQPLLRYAEAFGVTDAETCLFAEIRTRARRLLGALLPTVWVHWGFEMRNLFRDGNHITVIDWEGGSAGLPLFDMVYFVNQWYQNALRTTSMPAKVRAFRSLFLGSKAQDPCGRAAKEALVRYIREVNLNPEFVPILMVSMWVFRALGRLERQAHMEGERELVGTKNPYGQYVQALAQDRNLLFQARY